MFHPDCWIHPVESENPEAFQLPLRDLCDLIS